MNRPHSPSGRDETAPAALSYTNRRGDTYYLHEGRTRTGKPRFFAARAVGEGALARMPEGYEFAESINAVVSVARKGRDRKAVPVADLEIVQAELACHKHLVGFKAAKFRGDIVVYQPLGGGFEDRMSILAPLFWPGTPQSHAAVRERALARQQFDPVFKFTPVAEAPGVYVASRMSYRGHGGWLELRSGPLTRLTHQYIRLLGTDELFEHF